MRSADHIKKTEAVRGKSTDSGAQNTPVTDSSISQDDTMIYTLAHDIKSPINQVEGLLVIASKMSDNEDMQNILQMALSANRKLSAKVNEMLDMNIREKNHEEFCLGSMVADLWGSISNTDESTTIKLIHQCRLDNDIKADRIRVKSILQNLIENAIKYRNPDNTSHSILINSGREDNMLVIKVTDNGMGIHSDNLDRIFSASFQEDNTKNGHGMGLYLAKRNAQTMGGDLKVQSKYREGTTFTLTIPFRGSAAAA